MKEETNYKFNKDEFPALVKEVLAQLAPSKEDRFISPEKARAKLNCSKSQLAIYRSTGKVAIVQDPDHPKQIWYDLVSIESYLLANLRKSF